MSRDHLDWNHRKRVLAMEPPQGQPCPCDGCARHVGFCRTPMWPHNSDADHHLPRILGGQDGPLRWLCRTCNRSRGATLGNKLRGARLAAAKQPRPSRDW